MATKLVSMKMSRAEQQEKYKAMAEPSGDGPIYPYGLRVNLDNDVMERLKLKELPEVGKSIMLVARVDVISVSSNETEDGKRESVELQITDLCLEKDTGEGGSAADRLYDGAQSEK